MKMWVYGFKACLNAIVMRVSYNTYIYRHDSWISWLACESIQINFFCTLIKQYILIRAYTIQFIQKPTKYSSQTNFNIAKIIFKTQMLPAAILLSDACFLSAKRNLNAFGQVKSSDHSYSFDSSHLSMYYVVAKGK
jgi:hypothetical protein